ncbi:hypothetical protein CLF_103906 [Clonorchis sinensis]|uniref:LysM domain-containing protein n=1 Tax=Clonorchis sinensis TaxID=79923 RepID=G7YAL4_CLOSI|nr:hypothetical protein CLF_103906 [Clonorchis sinensis]
MDVNAAKQRSLDRHLPLNDEKCVHMSFGGNSVNALVVHGGNGSEDVTRIDAKKDLGRRGKHYGTVGGCIRPAESYKLHYIEPDDTLVSIAVRYDTSVQHLKLLNHLWAADISNLRTLKVPAESPSMGHPLGDVELTPVRRKSASQKDECDEVPSATAYIRGLFERVQQAKESARSVLENSREFCMSLHIQVAGDAELLWIGFGKVSAEITVLVIVGTKAKRVDAALSRTKNNEAYLGSSLRGMKNTNSATQSWSRIVFCDRSVRAVRRFFQATSVSIVMEAAMLRSPEERRLTATASVPFNTVVQRLNQFISYKPCTIDTLVPAATVSITGKRECGTAGKKSSVRQAVFWRAEYMSQPAQPMKPDSIHRPKEGRCQRHAEKTERHFTQKIVVLSDGLQRTVQLSPSTQLLEEPYESEWNIDTSPPSTTEILCEIAILQRDKTP